MSPSSLWITNSNFSFGQASMLNFDIKIKSFIQVTKCEEEKNDFFPSIHFLKSKIKN